MNKLSSFEINSLIKWLADDVGAIMTVVVL